MKKQWAFAVLILSMAATSLSCGISVDLGSPFASKTPIPPTETVTEIPPTATQTAIPPTPTYTATVVPSPTELVLKEEEPTIAPEAPEPTLAPSPTPLPQLQVIKPENGASLTLMRAPNIGAGTLQKIVISPDGKLILFSYSTSLILHNMNDMSLIWKVDPGRYITDIAFTKDGSHLISCSPGGLVEMRDIATGSPLGVIIPQREGVRSISLSAHAEYFAVLDYSGVTTLWDVSTGKQVQDNNGKANPGGINSILLTPGGGTLLIEGIGSAGNKQVQQWDVTTGNYKIGLLGVIHEMTNWKFSPDTKRIFGVNTRSLTAVPGNTLTAWNALNGTIIKRYPQMGIITDYKISSDGTTILVATKDGQLRILDTENGTIKASFSGLAGSIAAMEFTSDNQGVITVTSDGKLSMLDTVTQAIVKQMDFYFPLTRFPMTMSAGGKLAAFLTTNRKQVGILETSGFTTIGGYGPEEYLLSLPTISLSGKLVAAINENNQLVIWDVASGKKLQSIEVKTREPIKKMKFTPDDKMIATLSVGQIIFWDVTTGKKLKEMAGQNDFAYSPAEKIIASDSSDNKLYFSSVDTGKLLSTTTSEIIDSLAFSPDGKVVAIGAQKNQPTERGLNNMIYQVDPTSKERMPVEMPEIPGTISSMAFSPNMRTLAASDSQGNILMWDLWDGRKIASFDEIAVYPSTLTFNEAGTILYVTGSDSTISLISTTVSGSSSQAQSGGSPESSAVPQLSSQPYTHSTGSVTVNLPMDWKLEEQSPTMFTSSSPNGTGYIAFLALNTIKPLTDEGFMNFIDGCEKVFSVSIDGYKEFDRGVEPSKGTGFVSKTILLAGKEFIFESYYTRDGSIVNTMNFMTQKPYAELYLPLYQGVFASLKVHNDFISQQTPYNDYTKINDPHGAFTYLVPTGWGKDIKDLNQPVTFVSPEGTGSVHLEILPAPSGDDTQKFVALQTLVEQQEGYVTIVNRIKGENQSWEIVYSLPDKNRNGAILGVMINNELQVLNVQYPSDLETQYLPLVKKIISNLTLIK